MHDNRQRYHSTTCKDTPLTHLFLIFPHQVWFCFAQLSRLPKVLFLPDDGNRMLVRLQSKLAAVLLITACAHNLRNTLSFSEAPLSKKIRCQNNYNCCYKLQSVFLQKKRKKSQPQCCYYCKTENKLMVISTSQVPTTSVKD